MLEKKDYVSMSEGVHKQKLQLAKVFVTRILYWFQRKAPKCKYWVLKVLCLQTQMVCSGWLKTDAVCVCSAHQNVVLLAYSMDWKLTQKYLIKLILFYLN